MLLQVIVLLKFLSPQTHIIISRVILTSISLPGVILALANCLIPKSLSHILDYFYDSITATSKVAHSYMAGSLSEPSKGCSLENPHKTSQMVWVLRVWLLGFKR